MSKIFVSSYVRFLLWSWIAFITSASVIHKAKRRGRLLLIKSVIKSKSRRGEVAVAPDEKMLPEVTVLSETSQSTVEFPTAQLDPLLPFTVVPGTEGIRT